MTGIVADWHGGWARYRGRLAAVPATRNAPAVAGVALGLAALAEAVARGLSDHLSVVGVLTAAILALCTTVPLAFLGPAPAAVCIVVAGVLSLTTFRLLTVAGLAATLIALYLLGRDGWSPGGTGRTGGQWLAPVLAVPFVIVALTGSRSLGSEQEVLAVLLAALAPAAALAGIAQRARIQAHVHIAARQVIADSLVEHTARGERARIARELHDVVAHHISMIAVQAETARLTTPGMPAAGAQRLLEIGDTARAGLTEMRRMLGVLREDAQAADPLPGTLTGVPSRASSSSTSCSTRPGRPGARACGSSCPGRRPPSTPGSSWLPTASSRKASPTPGGMRRAPRSTWNCDSPRPPCGCGSGTTAPGRPRCLRWPTAATG